MKRDLSIRRQAYQLYVKTANISEVARQLNIKRHTCYAWSIEDNWDQRLADVTQKLQIHLDAVKKFEDNTILRLYFQELRFLDYLQEQVSEALIAGEIKPKTWTELINTQKFILERRERLLGLLGSPEDKKRINAAMKEVEELSETDAKRCLESGIIADNKTDGAKLGIGNPAKDGEAGSQ